MPAFFETFPVILLDQGGTVRADIPFRRAESRYSIEQTNVILYFQLIRTFSFAFDSHVFNMRFRINPVYWNPNTSPCGDNIYSSPAIVKNYARKAQFGEIFTFDKKSRLLEGVFRTSPRGWYSFSHTVLSFLFFLGHLWHAGRSLFQEANPIPMPVSMIGPVVAFFAPIQVEYGRNEKLAID